ncbi:MAG: hypothetical protein JO057_05225 [Chloroflexi bacterium]|nr:hypothetical protein [Chloroflexota bacterium]
MSTTELHGSDPPARAAIDKEWLFWMINGCAEPVILIDANGAVILQNTRAESLFKSSPEDGEGRRRAVESNTVLFSAALKTAGRSTHDLTLVDPLEGTELLFEMRTLPATNDLSGERGTVAVLTNITDLQDVSRLRELERRRIEQILFDSEKLAATGRLAASIAHEINNPLEAIKNALYLLTNKTSPDDPNAKFLQIATRETDRVARILRQMLGFYRPPKMEPTDINRLIEDTESLIEKHLRQSRIALEMDLDPTLPPVIASADQIKQVLLNLMLNAQQSMPDGGTLYVSTRVAHGADPEFLMSDSIHIQIRDTGGGIPEEHLPHIFEPFFSTKAEKGTGLGLWVSQGIVQAHGGSIKLRSRPGRGTTFSVTLPIGGPAEHGDG